jgi:hypothetical protein
MKNGFNVDSCCVHILHKIFNQEDLESHIIDNRSETFIKINARNWDVSKINKSYVKNSVSFHFLIKDPLAFDAPPVIGSVIGIDYFPYCFIFHFIRLFVDCFSPLSLIKLAATVPNFIKIYWLLNNFRGEEIDFEE